MVSNNVSYYFLYPNKKEFKCSCFNNLTFQVGVGDIANRVITVGSEHRAEKIASFLDATPAPTTITSNRGFSTTTGFFNGVNVSIVSIGMVCIPFFLQFILYMLTEAIFSPGSCNDGFLCQGNQSCGEGTYGHDQVTMLNESNKQCMQTFLVDLCQVFVLTITSS